MCIRDRQKSPGVLENPPQPNKIYPISTQGDYTPQKSYGILAASEVLLRFPCSVDALTLLVGEIAASEEGLDQLVGHQGAGVELLCTCLLYTSKVTTTANIHRIPSG